ncbi:hypothetical protein AB0C52_24285 [Streptomyces sp. NPDC048717]|uniref:hypothetical protein n=1 Tax=Streptomyces sp. NPDC048717 TaxID=3154928 RepID=UPI00342FF8BC
MSSTGPSSRSLADFATFLTVRPDLGLGPGTLACAEIAAGLRLPQDERHDPLVHAVTSSTRAGAGGTWRRRNARVRGSSRRPLAVVWSSSTSSYSAA